MKKREPREIYINNGWGNIRSFDDVLAMRANSLRHTDWAVDREWEIFVYRSRKLRSIIECEPEEILDVYEGHPDLFQLPKGCPPALAPHPELRSNIKRRAHMD